MQKCDSREVYSALDLFNDKDLCRILAFSGVFLLSYAVAVKAEEIILPQITVTTSDDFADEAQNAVFTGDRKASR